MAKQPEKKCSFCDRSESDVNILFTGIKGNICDQCIENAHSLLVEATGNEKQKKDERLRGVFSAWFFTRRA